MARKRRRTYAAGEAVRHRHSWLELLQVSGPFVTLPVVNRVWPTGVPAVPTATRGAIRSSINDSLDDGGASRVRAVRNVLTEALDWGTHLRWQGDIPAALAEPVAEHGIVHTADFGFYADEVADQIEDTVYAEGDIEDDAVDEAEGTISGPWRTLGMISAWGTHPLTRTTDGAWSASAVERLAVLLRARDVPVGIVTDGRWWAIVWAPIGGTTGAAVWDASLWSEEPESFNAFVALLQRSRFLAVADEDTLPSLLSESLDAQEEVTVTLGLQVRDAVELLLETLDRLNSESNVLAGVDDDELYDGVVTVMMRIVFLLFAEERRLLPSDDELYVAAYSVGRLVEQLEADESLSGSQALEYRTGAWHRLLATSRALHAGVAHEDLRLPAYGGALFDPKRFLWLEGRQGSSDVSARPPAVDDATVLRLLRAVQYVEIDGERRRLTFRALDVEQIGYVYEGLLELEVRTATEVVLQVLRSKEWPKGKGASEVPLSEVRGWLAELPPQLEVRLKALTARKDSKIETLLAGLLKQHESEALERHVGAELAAEIRPLLPVLRWDSLRRPAVVLPGRRYIAPSTRRASTGAHYTPRSLAEEVANNALEPLVFRPGPLETADRDTWQIRPSTEILALRVADIAMGSGAFLVAACRYLADRLIEAWQAEGRPDAVLTTKHSRQRTLSADAEVERLALDARRRIADRCLYGVDINPLAVEMAKLSLWLVTMDRERPFGFLDDRFVVGDSLLGITHTAQLEQLHLEPNGSVTFDSVLRENELARTADLRRRITAHPVTTGRDVQTKLGLLDDANRLTAELAAVADALVGVGLRVKELKSLKKMDAAFAELAMIVEGTSPDWIQNLVEQVDLLQAGRPPGVVPRDPLHWPIAFPEVFFDVEYPGFDAIIGNPPFLGGKKISGSLGDDYLASLVFWDGKRTRGSADLAARFLLRANRLLSERGQLGYIATNTLVQGATLKVGLLQVAKDGLEIRRATPSHPWLSGSASLEIVDLWCSRAPVAPGGLRVLANEEVPAIGIDLEPVGRVVGRPIKLRENENVAFVGSYVLGLGFTLTAEEAKDLILLDPKNAEVLQPYVIGRDLNRRPDCSASRWIINFRDFSLAQAEEYPTVVEILRRLVKPERESKSDKGYREYWWRHARRGSDDPAIVELKNVLALSIVSNAVMPVRVRTGPVFAHKCAIFAFEDFESLAILSSCAHTVWVVRYTSTMRTDINYSPSDVFLTLPRPKPTPDLGRLGKLLDTERRALMMERAWGLTQLYNRVHDPSNYDSSVASLRQIHVDIDNAVMSAYGWNLDLEIGHHRTKIGTRWTVSPRARFELLDLLLEENHRRADMPK